MFQIKEFTIKVLKNFDGGYPSLESDVNNFLRINSDKIKNVIDIKHSTITKPDYSFVTITIIYEE